MHDLLSVIRGLLRRPLYPLVAVAILALGLTAAIAVFTYVNGFYQPFPGVEAKRLVRLFGVGSEEPYQEIPYLDFLDYKEAGGAFEGLAAVQPWEGVRDTLAALRGRDLHLGIVSNIDEDQFQPLWERIGLGPHFDAVTTSEEARSCKPHPGIYRHALGKAGNVAPEEVVFVGDSVEYDVVGAKALGMTTVLITEGPNQAGGGIDPDHVIEAIPELLHIVSA